MVDTDGIRIVDADHGGDKGEDQQGEEHDRHEDSDLLLHEVLPDALPVGVVRVAGLLRILRAVLGELEQLLFGHAEAVLDVDDAAGILLLGVGLNNAVVGLQADGILVLLGAIGIRLLRGSGVHRQLGLHLDIAVGIPGLVQIFIVLSH